MTPRPNDDERIVPLLDMALAAGYQAEHTNQAVDSPPSSQPILLRDLPDHDTEVVQPHSAAADAFTGQRYQILGEIARGGVGLVLKGRDSELGRDIAIKVLRDEHANNPRMVRRFVEEAQIAGQLQHPGILPVHDFGWRSDQRPFFTMKLVRGKTLGALLSELEHSANDQHRLLGLFHRLCETMTYAHARGVIHRDLKPSNILIGAFGELHVTDWGLAKVLGGTGGDEDRSRVEEPLPPESNASEQRADESISGSVMGTPAYMAPEQARGQVDRIDRRSDVFGLGAILCEILCGQPPYTGANEREIRDKAARADFGMSFDRLAAAAVDPALIDLVRSCLDPELDRRLPDAGAVAEAVDRYLADFTERARRAQVEAAEARVELRAARRARRLTVGLAASLATVVALISGGIGIWNWLEGRHRAEVVVRIDAISSSLTEALQYQADAAASGGDAVGLWQQAHKAASRAVSLVRPGDMPEQLGLRAHRVLATSEEGLRRAREDQTRKRENKTMLRAMSACRFTHILTEEEIAQRQTAEAAFRDLGIDLFDADEVDALSALRARGMDPRELAAGLDQLLQAYTVLPAGEKAARLLTLANEVDPDPWRRELRTARANADPQGAFAMLRSPRLQEQSASAIAMAGDVYFHWARRHLGHGDRESQLVEAALRAAADREPGAFDLNLLLAHLFSSGEMAPTRWVEALSFARAAVATREDDPIAWRELGLIWVGLEHHDYAALTFARASELAPGNLFLQRLQSRALQRSGRQEQALAILDGLFEKGVRKDKMFFRRRLVRSAMDTTSEELVAAGEKALQVTPEDAMTLFHLAIDYRYQGRCDRAAELIQKAIDLQPGRWWYQLHLGDYLRDAGHLDEALAAYAKSRELRGDPGFLAQRIQAVELMRDLAEEFEPAVANRRYPEDPVRRRAFARLCRIRGHVNLAADLYSEVAATDPALIDTDSWRYYAAVACVQARGVNSAAHREHALGWLRSYVAATRSKWASTDWVPVQAYVFVLRLLLNPEFSAVRDAARRAELPLEEQPRWDALWADVHSLRDEWLRRPW